MRAKHFADKLGILIDNCPTSQRSENANTLRVSVPHFQTKDAIEQLQLLLDEIAKHIKKEMNMAICETPSCEEKAVTSKLHPIGGEYCAECAKQMKINEGKTNEQDN